MNDLNDNPRKVAEDIINQTRLGFQEEATVRIVRILETYHQLQNELAKFKEQQETESAISYDGYFAWRITEGQKEGPYCAACHVKDKELIRLLSRKDGSWDCVKCGRSSCDSTYQGPDAIDDSNRYNWTGGRQES